MIRLMVLTGAVISPEQVLERHYFLEVLNRPEYIWGIRAVCMAAAILAFFLYLKLKKSAVEPVMISTDISEAAADAEPIPEPTSEPDIEQVSEVASEPDIEQVSEVVSEPTFEPVPELSSEPSAAVGSAQRTGAKPVRKASAPSRVTGTIHEKDILLLALVGISIGGLILYTCGRKRGKR